MFLQVKEWVKQSLQGNRILQYIQFIHLLLWQLLLQFHIYLHYKESTLQLQRQRGSSIQLDREHRMAKLMPLRFLKDIRLCKLVMLFQLLLDRFPFYME